MQTVKPFTVIGGFLGAGKTTLVNHLLAASTGVRYALLVNDFGAINIDEQLISSHDGQTMALSNGCICCSMVNGFVDTMLALMEKPDRFDHIVVEASGVALPDKIMDFARIDPALYPEGIVVLADVGDIHNRLADPKVAEVVRSQLECASVLVLNKIDTVSEEQAQECMAAMNSINSSALLLDCHHADVPVELLFGRTLPVETVKRRVADTASAFVSHSVSTATPLDRDQFEQFRNSLPSHILRAKGIVHFSEQPTVAWLWQRTGKRDDLKKWRGASSGTSQAVLIASDEMPGPVAAADVLFDEKVSVGPPQ